MVRLSKEKTPSFMGSVFFVPMFDIQFILEVTAKTFLTAKSAIPKEQG
jgi:hypothetical protein